MGGLFSKKKKPTVNQHDRAVLDLKVQRDKLKQYQTKCRDVVAREVEAAKKLLGEGKKPQALLALKKKKYQEGLIEKSEGQLSNIEQMIDSIEFAQIEVKVFESLKAGNETLKEINSQMNIDDVEKLMDDTAEALAYQKEVEQLLSGQLTEEDDAEILEELQQLEDDTLKGSLPDVPQKELPNKQKLADPSTAQVEEVEVEVERKPIKEKKAVAVPA